MSTVASLVYVDKRFRDVAEIHPAIDPEAVLTLEVFSRWSSQQLGLAICAWDRKRIYVLKARTLSYSWETRTTATIIVRYLRIVRDTWMDGGNWLDANS